VLGSKFKLFFFHFFLADVLSCVILNKILLIRQLMDGVK